MRLSDGGACVAVRARWREAMGVPSAGQAARAQNSVELGVGGGGRAGTRRRQGLPRGAGPGISYERGALYRRYPRSASPARSDCRHGWPPIGGPACSSGMRLGRDADDHDRLEGLDDIDAHATVGGFLRWQPGPWRITTTVTQALRSGYGTRIELNSSYAIWDARPQRPCAWARKPPGAAMTICRAGSGSPAPRPRAAMPACNAIPAGAGLRSAALYANWRYARSIPGGPSRRPWGIRTLLGDARDSPIVERRTSPCGMVGVRYRFFDLGRAGRARAAPGGRFAARTLIGAWW